MRQTGTTPEEFRNARDPALRFTGEFAKLTESVGARLIDRMSSCLNELCDEPTDALHSCNFSKLDKTQSQLPSGTSIVLASHHAVTV
jgi:hypothetical protein